MNGLERKSLKPRSASFLQGSGMSWLWSSGLLLWLARPCRPPDLGADSGMSPHDMDSDDPCRLCLRRPSCHMASPHRPGVDRLSLLDLCLHHLSWKQHRPNLESHSGICQHSCEQAWVLEGMISSGQGGTRRHSRMQPVGAQRRGRAMFYRGFSWLLMPAMGFDLIHGRQHHVTKE